MSAIKLMVQGKGPLVLQDSDYLTEGGEARIYLKSGFAYKLFHDGMRRVDPAKLEELKRLDHPQINRPLDLLLDTNHQPVGYSMAAIDPAQSIPLPRLFVSDFRNRMGINDQTTLELIEQIKQTLHYIHGHNCLVVDLNENNFLVDSRSYSRAWFIDVCSWQTPNFPPTAIMANIRDYQNPNFSSLSDWFSFGILACQLFLGIHPFRGNHPDFDKIPPGERMVARMKAGVSIFNARASYPKAVRDIGLIPSAYRDWLVALFEHGKRMAPPDHAGHSGQVQRDFHLVRTSQRFKVTLLQTFPSEILSFETRNGTPLIRLDHGDTLLGRLIQPNTKLMPVLVTPAMGKAYFVERTDECVSLWEPTSGVRLSLPLATQEVVVMGNALYALTRAKLLELAVVEGAPDMLVLRQSWDLLRGQTRLFDGLLLVEALGTPYLILPVNSGTCHFIAQPALRGYRLVNAKYQERVAILVARVGNRLDKFILTWSPDFRIAHQRRIEDVDTGDINFTVKRNGITVHIHEDGQLEVFANDPARPDLKVVSDPKISQSMRLATNGTDIYFHQTNQLNQLTMR